MKKYDDKTLVVFPDDQIKVIMIPQSLLDYIEDLEKENQDYFKKHLNSYYYQNITYAQEHLYPQNISH